MQQPHRTRHCPNSTFSKAQSSIPRCAVSSLDPPGGGARVHVCVCGALHPATPLARFPPQVSSVRHVPGPGARVVALGAARAPPCACATPAPAPAGPAASRMMMPHLFVHHAAGCSHHNDITATVKTMVSPLTQHQCSGPSSSPGGCTRRRRRQRPKTTYTTRTCAPGCSTTTPSGASKTTRTGSVLSHTKAISELCFLKVLLSNQ